MQTSHVFSQRAWPGAGDVDDCWAVSGVQLVHCVAPWVHLASVPSFRRAAGDPDDGKSDGGSLAEILRGIRGVYPRVGALCRTLEKVPAATAYAALAQGRPLSLAVISAKLPRNLQFGFTGAHQVTIAIDGGRLLLANPLATPYSSWIPTTWADLRPAMAAHAGAGKVNAVVGPTDAEAVHVHPSFAPEAAASAAKAVAALETARTIATDAAARIAALKLA